MAKAPPNICDVERGFLCNDGMHALFYSFIGALFNHNRCPTMTVFHRPILDAAQGFIELGRPWTRFVAESIHLAGV